MRGFSRGGFAGRLPTGRVSVVQHASATPEMNNGFATIYPYDITRFIEAREAGEIIAITSADTDTSYGVQIRPVFGPDNESIRPSYTEGTIVSVNGRDLIGVTRKLFHLENRRGAVYVRPA